MTDGYQSTIDEFGFRTLPDLVAPGLDVLFVGINPSSYAVEHGHYFARRSNRFWPAFSRSRLSEPIRRALGRDVLLPEDDVRLPGFGIGFTDVVKVPSPQADALTPSHFRRWVPRLNGVLLHYRPRVACFHGLTGYRPFARQVLRDPSKEIALGPQPHTLGRTRLYLVPNPSGANAHFRLDDQTAWYNRLADYLATLDST